MTQRQFNLFDKTGEGNSLQEFEDIYQTSTTFIVSREGWYTVMIWNNSDEDARVQLDISIWP
jgi:hypothetical protein